VQSAIESPSWFTSRRVVRLDSNSDPIRRTERDVDFALAARRAAAHVEQAPLWRTPNCTIPGESILLPIDNNPSYRRASQKALALCTDPCLLHHVPTFLHSIQKKKKKNTKTELISTAKLLPVGPGLTVISCPICSSTNTPHYVSGTVRAGGADARLTHT
jgi:hypothetical protein